MVATVAVRGYAEARVEEVLDRASVTRQQFEEHFADKERCFLTAFDKLGADVLEVVARSYHVDAPWPERVRQGLRAFLAVLTTNPEPARVAMVESASAGSAIWPHYRAALRSFVPFFEDGRRLAANPERLSEQTANAVVGGIAAVVQDRVRRGQIERLGTLLPELAYFALTPYLGPPAAEIAAGIPLSA
jgi:AcrR family transcriptional regulator